MSNDCEHCGREDNDGVLVDTNGDRHPYCHRHRDEITAVVEAIDAPTRDDAPLRNLHKAEPLATTDHCLHCDQPVHQVPGGSGPVWVHEDGHVMARNTDAPPPPVGFTYSFSINAVVTGTDRQDAWDRWVEWLTEPANVENFTQVQQEGLVFVSSDGVPVRIEDPRAMRNTLDERGNPYR